MGPALRWFVCPVRPPPGELSQLSVEDSFLAGAGPCAALRICAGPVHDAAASEFLCVSVLVGVLTEFFISFEFCFVMSEVYLCSFNFFALHGSLPFFLNYIVC